MTDALVQRFLDGLAATARERFETWPGLQAQLPATLAALWQRAGVAEPLQPRFLLALAAAIDDDCEPADALTDVHAEDLGLACACAAGDGRALAAFDAAFLRDIDHAWMRGGEPGAREDFRQRVRERLLVAAPDGATRISAYGGRGPLRGWVRVAATRVMIDLVRKARPIDAPSGDAALFDRVADGSDAELDYMRQAYGAALPEAMRDGLASLTPRQRNLLRQRYLAQLPGERLAAMYGVHRATVFRWLEEARASLFTAMRAALGQRLHVAEHELDSVIGLLASRVHVSMRRILDSRLEE